MPAPALTSPATHQIEGMVINQRSPVNPRTGPCGCCGGGGHVYTYGIELPDHPTSTGEPGRLYDWINEQTSRYALAPGTKVTITMQFQDTDA